MKNLFSVFGLLTLLLIPWTGKSLDGEVSLLSPESVCSTLSGKLNEKQPEYARPVAGTIQKQLQAFISKRLNYFSQQGKWIGPDQIKQSRSLEPLALSHALLESGNPKAIEQANFYLSNAQSLEWHRAGFILLKYTKLLTEASKKNIRAVLDRTSAGYLKPFWDFVGVNDNFPSMATCGCALYGEISGKKEFTEAALKRLKEYKNQLIRSGVGSEYCSQAYCYLQIEGMAMLSEYTSNQELKKLALEVEAYYWFDVLGHFYMPARKMSAPYSRAYAWDLRGQGLTYSMLEQVIGKYLPFKLLDDYYEESEEWVKCRNAACYGITYHCPGKYVQQLVNRKYPYSFIAMADGSPSSDDMEMAVHGINMQNRKPQEDDGIMEYPAWQTRIETYMTSKYSVSTSTVPFHAGVQTENFLIVYPRKDIDQNFRNTATIFSRLVINNDETLEKPTDGYGDHGLLFPEKGRRMTIQDKNTAMVLYKPKADFCTNVKSLKTSVYIPENNWMRAGNNLDEIWIGSNKIAGISGISAAYETIYLKDGNVFMAFLPLMPTSLPIRNAVEIEHRSGYTILSFCGYEGEPRNFSKRAFMNLGSGFVCEIASSDEYPSFEAFCAAMAKTKITDEYRENDHSRRNSVRHTRYEKPGLVLENEYSPCSEGIRYSTVNGQYIEKPRIKVSGIHDYPFDQNKIN